MIKLEHPEIKAAVVMPAESSSGQGPLIRSGYSATAQIVLQGAQHVLAIPEAAIEFSGDSTFVYVANDPQAVQPVYERRLVQTGISDGIYIEIRSGLKEGETIRGGKVIAPSND